MEAICASFPARDHAMRCGLTPGGTGNVVDSAMSSRLRVRATTQFDLVTVTKSGQGILPLGVTFVCFLLFPLDLGDKSVTAEVALTGYS